MARGLGLKGQAASKLSRLVERSCVAKGRGPILPTEGFVCLCTVVSLARPANSPLSLDMSSGTDRVLLQGFHVILSAISPLHSLNPEPQRFSGSQTVADMASPGERIKHRLLGSPLLPRSHISRVQGGA